MNNLSESILQKRVNAAFQLSFIGDALAMPVHWYYKTPDIFRLSLKEFINLKPRQQNTP